MILFSQADRWVAAARHCARTARLRRQGRVRRADVLGVDIVGLRPSSAIGDRFEVSSQEHEKVAADVVRVGDSFARTVVFGSTAHIAEGDAAEIIPNAELRISLKWRGRVLDPFGKALDDKGRLGGISKPCPSRAAPPQPATRQRLGPAIGTGVRVLDAFCTMREAQRIGLFAASGIGKSTLLATLARSKSFDTIVLGLVGERGRELREFIEDDLGPAGLERSVIICATSDAPAALRREAAYSAMAAAEFFRDEGQRVLLLLDSVTRFALACREIGLAAGEPPATRGYPPSVFRELACLLERAGPGAPGTGSITAVMTVLVEGDDHDEPIADAVRGILDGHVVLDRRIAEGGRYPAVDILRSLSRSVPGCLTSKQALLAQRARSILATRDEFADLVRMGAYRTGTDPVVDEALRLAPRIEAMLQQRRGEISTLDGAFADLDQVLVDAPR